MYSFKLTDDSLIGTGNSSFQSEGSWDKDGKSETWIEHYAKLYAGKHRWKKSRYFFSEVCKSKMVY